MTTMRASVADRQSSRTHFMNSHIFRRQSRDGLFSKFARGQSMTELAIAVPVLALLLVASADFARVFYFSIAVNNAARAVAQYGSQSIATASHSNGMMNDAN